VHHCQKGHGIYSLSARVCPLNVMDEVLQPHMLRKTAHLEVAQSLYNFICSLNWLWIWHFCNTYRGTWIKKCIWSSSGQDWVLQKSKCYRFNVV